MSLMQPAEGRESYKAGSFPVKRKTSPRDAPLARKLFACTPLKNFRRNKWINIGLNVFLVR